MGDGRMRSEEEIKEEDFWDYMETDYDRNVDYLNSKKLKSWLLYGEPRYSIAELEKIVKGMSKANLDADVDYFVEQLKDTKKVQEILKGDSNE